MRIDVIWALPRAAVRQTLEVSPGASLQSVRRHPQLLPELQAAWDAAAGLVVFGKKASLRQPLMEGDRIEILRPLRADPKEARRARALAQKASRGSRQVSQKS